MLSNKSENLKVSEPKVNNSENKYSNKKSRLHLHLLNAEDVRLIKEFLTAFYKAGRTLTEETFDWDPRRKFYKIYGTTVDELKSKFGNQIWNRFKDKFSKLLMDR
jgi:hypothetical protein